LRSNVPNAHRPIFVPSRHQQTVRMELHRMNFRVTLDFANRLSLLQIKEAPIFIFAADREVIIQRLKWNVRDVLQVAINNLLLRDYVQIFQLVGVADYDFV
jgi:hypothetical protein